MKDEIRRVLNGIRGYKNPRPVYAHQSNNKNQPEGFKMIEILNYKPINKGAMKGSFSIKMPKWGNFIIKDCTHMSSGKGAWFNFPQKMYESEGEKKYFPYCTFDSPETLKEFQREVMNALADCTKDMFENVPF